MRGAIVRRAGIAAAFGAVVVALSPASAGAAPLSDCFWLGPITVKQRAANFERFDGRYFNFPEESATYWLARFRLSAGQRLVLRGRYPHARYESLNSYRSGGTPAFSLPDVKIRPRGGAKNPFIAGARRGLSRRGWTVNVLDQPAPPAGAEARNTVYAPSTSTFASELVLRVYEPDRGRDLTGGVGLPRPEIVNPDGTRIRGLRAVCQATNDRDRSIARTVQSIPAATWNALVNTPGPRSNPATSPAFDPPLWERFFSQGSASGAFQLAAGNPRPMGPFPDVGGFYSNLDTRYVLTHLSRKFGEVLVIRGKMPRFPHTHNRAKRMPSAQLRFWSLCSNESRVTTYAADCLADRQVPLRRNRRYTIVVSRSEDRPSNARKRCGVAWLDWPRRGNVAGNSDYALLIMRNMLPSRSFRQAIQNITRLGDERAVMGPYFPRSAYTSTAGFRKLGCK